MSQARAKVRSGPGPALGRPGEGLPSCRRPVPSWLLPWLLALLGAAPAAWAEGPRGTLSLLYENDVFQDTDQHYTNGVALIWVPEPKEQPGWVHSLVDAVPWMPKQGQIRHGYMFGQNMYTPEDIELPDPPLTDRPYAGWLYGSVGVGVESGKQLDVLTLTVGVVGPASLAEQTQKFIHDLIDADEPRGWDTQLDNELGLVATYQRSWREAMTMTAGGFQADLTPHLGAALGNVYTYANTGFTLRWGRDLPRDYGPPRIQPSSPGSGLFNPRKGFGWYLFAGVDGRAVARNIFLDGNTFEDSRSVDKESFVGDVQFGLVLTWETVRLAYTHVLRSREYETQSDTDGFGALSLSVKF